MFSADFHFCLPPEFVAQVPSDQRDASRLLVYDRLSDSISHFTFRDLPTLLHSGDLLVLNNSKVFPARLHGTNDATGGAFEVFLLQETNPNEWWTLMNPAKRARPGTRIRFHDRSGIEAGLVAEVIEGNNEGHRRLRFLGGSLRELLDRLGEVPLPPYIKRDARGATANDLERYQTVYASTPGSVAAPTAGLHFTDTLLARIRERGVEVCFVTLHVGLGTFAPVKTDRVEDHVMHEEHYEVCAETAGLVNTALESGRRVVAVGTTSLRVLESAVEGGRVAAGTGRTRIFIYPPFHFRVVGALVTNFHLPASTLLMLVSAFAAPGETGGRERMLQAYAAAVRERYRFFSYGDAMLIQ